MQTQVIIYTRFSPRPDAEDCDSCETQRKVCEEFAKRQGWEVVSVVADEGISGADECRPKLIDAVNSLKPGGVLLVYRFDRIARNVYLFETVRRKVEEQKAQLIAVSGDIECGDEAIRTLVRQILAAVAEYERKMIAQRVSTAMRTKQRDGRRMSARPPYGWAVDPTDKSRLVVNPEEMATLDNMRLLHASGFNYAEIARKLDPAMSRGGKWYPLTVQRILERTG